MTYKHETNLQHTDPSNTIIVIGGGSVGTSFLRQLPEQIDARENKSSIKRVILFDPSSNPGAGDAYQQDTPSNLLNTRVASMSPIAADPEHFQRWLNENPKRWRSQFPGLEPTADSFVPRALFGIYMEYVFDEAVEMLRERGVVVEHVPQRVASVRRVKGRYEVLTVNEQLVCAASVILAIGNLETQDWDHLRTTPVNSN